MKIFANKTVAVTAIALAVAGCNSDTLPDKTGNSFGQLALSGDARVGETLTTSVTDANGVDSSAISYTWMADGSAISGATSSTLMLSAAQAGTSVSVSVAYTDNDGYSEVITSPDTQAVLINYDGMLEITGILEANKLLTATLVDDNGFDELTVTYQWYADGVAIDGETASTLALTDDEVGKAITVMATYVDDDEYAEEILSEATALIAPAAANTPATFDGLTASVTNAVTDDLTGTITVTDADVGENMLVAQTDVVTTFGTFSVLDTGAWTYTLDTANATVASLVDESDMVTDTIAVESADGTMADLVISITGAAVVAPTQVAKITDNMTDDAGELRYKLGSSDIIPAGKITVSFLKEAGIEKDAYIGLYGASTSTSNAIIDLRIQSTGYVIRDNNDIDVTIPFTENKWTEVEMTWDATSATDTVAPLLTVTIDGTSVTTDPFASSSGSLSDIMAGVQTVIFKLGDNSSTIGDSAFLIDDFVLYSDIDGTVVQFEDDFESYSEGDSLDTDNASSPYNSSTAETVVALVGGSGGGEPTNPDNLTAKITDNMTDDAGELRYKLSSSDIISAGKLTVSFLKEAGIEKDAYIGLYGASTSTSDAIIDLRIQSGGFVIRDNADIDITIPFTADKWTDVEMTWDASAASDTVAPVLTLTIDGTSVTSDAFSSASSALTDIMLGVQTVIFKLGDNSSVIGTPAYYVDDFKLYSDIDGTTIQFEDDFEGYTEGVSLDTDNASTPYNSSTAETVVAVKEK